MVYFSLNPSLVAVGWMDGGDVININILGLPKHCRLLGGGEGWGLSCKMDDSIRKENSSKETQFALK